MAKIRPKFDAHNANKGTKEGRALLEESIERYGYGRSILIDKENNVIAGNKTLEAAAKRGLQEVRVIESDGHDLIAVKRTDLDLYHSPEARELAYADNRVAELNLTWNADAILTDFKSPNLDIGWMFHDIEQFRQMREQLDRENISLDEQRQTQQFTLDLPNFTPGDLIECQSDVIHEPHVLLCGDSRHHETFRTLFERVPSIQCVITSPPYADQREYDGITYEDLREEDLAKFLAYCAPFVPYCVVNLGLQWKHGEINEYWEVYKQTAKHAGYHLLAWNVWDKTRAGTINAQATFMFPCEHEWIFVFGHERKEINRIIPITSYQDNAARSASKQFVNVSRREDGTLRTSTNRLNTFKKMASILHEQPQQDPRYQHSAKFPLTLPYQYLLSLTQPGETVLDPFVGSGTTLDAAERAERRGIGIDISSECLKTAIQRWFDTANEHVVDIRINGDSIL